MSHIFVPRKMTDKSKQEFMQKFLNNARKKALNIGAKNTPSCTNKKDQKSKEEMKNQDWLTK